MSELRKPWQKLRLKYVTTINDEVLNEDTPEDYEIQYIDIGDVNSSGEITGCETMTFKGAPSRARRKVQHGDVIVSTVRTYLKAIAPIVAPPANLIVSTGFAVVRPNSKLDYNFAKYALRNSEFIDQVVARSVGVSYPAITSQELADIAIYVPPIDEQKRISLMLDEELSIMDELKAEKERFSQLLELKRAAVIAEAVTGRLS